MTTLALMLARVAQSLEDPTGLKWEEDQVEEALRQALDVYSGYLPHRGVAAVTLAVAGREIDLSASGPTHLAFTAVERVWWDYDEDDPAHPPAWRDFEVWPGPVLHINSTALPRAGDVVRIWYTAPHTLDGLDGAGGTTFPAEHASVLVLGATAYAALSRSVTLLEEANVNAWAGRNLREWAELQLARYRHELERLARQAAAQGSGIATAPPLDRWGRGEW